MNKYRAAALVKQEFYFMKILKINDLTPIQ